MNPDIGKIAARLRARPGEVLQYESDVLCVLTRFRLKSSLFLLPCYFDFVRTRRSAGTVSGLLRSAFLLESPRVFFTLSLWANQNALDEFNLIQTHVTVARRSMRRVYDIRKKRVEIWSVQMRIQRPSLNLNWGDNVPWYDLIRLAEITQEKPSAASR